MKRGDFVAAATVNNELILIRLIPVLKVLDLKLHKNLFLEFQYHLFGFLMVDFVFFLIKISRLLLFCTIPIT